MAAMRFEDEAQAVMAALEGLGHRVDEISPGRYVHTFSSEPMLRRERCAGSGTTVHGHATLCPCGQIIPKPAEAGDSWEVPEHDGECSW